MYIYIHVNSTSPTIHPSLSPWVWLVQRRRPHSEMWQESVRAVQLDQVLMESRDLLLDISGYIIAIYYT
jgi:hypothetical protein